MANQSPDPRAAWDVALGNLELQMPRESFDTWLRDTRLIAYEQGTYIIAVPNNYAYQWLDRRLRPMILRALSAAAQRSVEVRFVIRTGHHKKDDAIHESGPLLADLAPEPEPTFEHRAPGVSNLNPHYIFDTYISGPSNRLAAAAAQAMIDEPGFQFNPLYIYGDVGLGKTHLLHAIGAACVEAGHDVLFVPAETFTNDLVAAIKGRTTNEFREKYRTLDVLLVDDVQFLAGKTSSEEEFFHTFNTLLEHGAQIVVAGNAAPAEIGKLDARLRSRFEGGLAVEIQPPDFETRLAILNVKADYRGYGERVPLEVLEVIADATAGSVRELEGALNRVIAAALLNDGVPTLQIAEGALGEVRAAQMHSEAAPPPALIDILTAVADYYDLSVDQIVGRGRAREVSSARQVMIYLARELADASLNEIGDVLGGRNHSTVLYSYERVADLMTTDSQVRRHVTTLRQVLQLQPQPQKQKSRRTIRQRLNA